MSLQERQKWDKPRRNIQVGDIVLLKDQSIARNHWKTARAEETYQDEDGLVRKVRIVVGDAQSTRNGKRIRNRSVLERPIQKLILLFKSDSSDEDSSTGSLV